jgi:manganese-dependent ADP-ribose/CDP-alcohol diphosphatase
MRSCWAVFLFATLLPPLRKAFVVVPTARNSNHLKDMNDISGSEHFQIDVAEQELLPPPPPLLLGPPRFTVGVIADIQYAPIPDGYSFSGVPRYYRHSLEVARHAAAHFECDKVAMVLNLGDTVDGKCQEIERNGGDPPPVGVDPGIMSVDEVLEAFSVYKSGKIIHTYGNHCLYNLDRQTIGSKLGIPFVKEPCGDLVGYSSHVHDGVRFIVIDSYDVALMKRCEESSQKRKQAAEILSKNNPNFPENENSPEGLEGEAKRFVAFNGAVGKPQLDWLRETLSEARECNEKVVLLSHQPILPDSSSPVCLVWNYMDVLVVIREFSDIIVASFSGHAHQGGYKRDAESGIHFRVFEAALESQPEKTYAMVDVYDDRLLIRGFGNCNSAVFDFEHMTTRNVITTKDRDVNIEEREGL